MAINFPLVNAEEQSANETQVFDYMMLSGTYLCFFALTVFFFRFQP